MDSLITLEILTIVLSRYIYFHISSSPLSNLPPSTSSDIMPQIEEDTEEKKEIKNKTNGDIEDINIPK